MMHSNLARWIEAADAREVLLQSGAMRERQKVSQHQYIHLGQTVKKVFARWRHDSDGHMCSSDHGQSVMRH